MLFNAHHLTDTPDRADILVVGAGAVGLVLAVDLARSGHAVTVLEAGSDTLEASSQQLFENARWEGYPLEGLHVGRFRVLGGTTNFWGGQLMAPPPQIFAQRPWVADVAWPIAEADLSPYYQRLFNLLGMQGQIDHDVDVWRRIGQPAPPAADDLEVVFSRWVPETNFARLFREDIAHSPLLKVYINAPVTALCMDAGGTQAQGVEVTTRQGKITFPATRVVLANGTVEISRLLKLPLQDGRMPVWCTNPWLGKCFMDHIDCVAGRVIPIDTKRFHNLFDNVYLDGIKYCPKIQLKTASQTRMKDVGVLGAFLFNSSIQEHLVNFKIFVRALLKGKFDWNFFRYPRQIFDILRIAAPMIVRYVRYRRMYNPADQGIHLHLTTEQIPIAHSEIQLEAERDDLGMPKVRVRWNIEGSELKTMSFFARAVRDYLAETGLARLTLDPLLEAADPAFLAKIDDGNHQIGGARMAASPDQGVVDADCAVHGTQNLFIAGAATFPTAGPQNPTFTAMALALRLRDRLIRP